MDTVLQAGVVSAPLQVLIDKFATFALGETCIILGADKEFAKLRRTIERVKAMVSDVEENHSLLSNSRGKEAWKIWVEEVERLVYSADDLLDGVSLELSRAAATGFANADPSNQVRNALISSLELNIPREINRHTIELENIVREMEVLYHSEFTNLRGFNMGFNYKPLYNGYSCGRSSLVDERSVIGRQRDRDEIVDKLLDQRLSTTNFSVIPIVGMCGIGKTTVAQLVYNDDRLVEEYNLKSWASVSIDFDVIRITKLIVESASKKRCKLSGLDAVQVELQDLIRGKRFLLVLDDYWSEEYKDWEILCSPLRVGAKGSKILLTTRSMMVSQIVGTVPPHCLKSLTDKDSWELVKQRATSNRDYLTWELEDIGRKIARKCKGLPLAAKAVGSMLRFKVEPKEWINILNSELWDLYRHDNEVFPALALSYYDLPAHLKNCFAYCSIFPKNHNFEINELVSLWMAEGFIRPCGNVRLEDLGNNYFSNLHLRSFFHLSGHSHGQSIYKMHDLIHNMAQLISGRTCLHLDDNQPNEDDTFFRNIRHISLNCPTQQQRELRVFPWYENLRTLVVIPEYAGKIRVPYELFVRLKSLRVLYLSRLGLDELPDSFDHLKHLRYLNLSSNDFTMLPKSLTNLFGLQILKLEQCPKLSYLPKNMKKMVGLEQLHVDINLLDVNGMPPEFGKLVNLQSIPAFIVGSTEQDGIGQLKNMNLLRGCLCIKNLENVGHVNEAKQAMLHQKPFLDRLKLVWDDSRARCHHQDVLAGLQPHENLKELSMTNYSGWMLPGWFGSPTCKLSTINLKGCKDYNVITTIAKLKHVESLVIEDMPSWQQVDQDFSGFQSLESLTLINIPNLRSWSEFSGSRFPKLRILRIKDCQMLTNLPSLVATHNLHWLEINRCREIRQLPADGFPESLKELKISESSIITERCRVQEGEDWERISLIQNIEIDYKEIPWGMRGSTTRKFLGA